MSKYNLPRKRCQIKFIGRQHELYTVTVINVASQGNLAGVEPAKLSRDTGTEARGYTDFRTIATMPPLQRLLNSVGNKATFIFKEI